MVMLLRAGLCWAILSSFALAQTNLWSIESEAVAPSPDEDTLSIEKISVDEDLFHQLSAGQPVLLPVAEGETLIAHLGHIDAASESFGGELESNPHSKFGIRNVNGVYDGLILDYDKGFGYLIHGSPNQLYLYKKQIGGVICVHFPSITETPSANALAQSPSPQTYTGIVVPRLSSNPEATHVLYLDFDGEVVENTLWNTAHTNGQPIHAEPMDLDGDPTTFSTRELERIEKIWAITAEKFAPFDVNVTTDRAQFDAMPFERREQNIITITRDWTGANWGGVSLIGVFERTDIDPPSWTWNLSIGGAVTVAHEFGHALGLGHDGREFPDGAEEEYYQGGQYWSPIMGYPKWRPIQMWNKGDYLYADNQQDDLAILASKLGLLPDEYGDAVGRASRASAVRWGTIGIDDDADFYYLDLAAPQRISATLTVDSVPDFPDVWSWYLEFASLNARLSLFGPSGTLLAESEPVHKTVSKATSGNIPYTVIDANAELVYDAPKAGRYTLKVSGAGYTSTNPLRPEDTFPSYGSVGSYTLTADPIAKPDPVTLPPIFLLLLDEEE